VSHAAAGDTWKGFSAVRALSARESEVLLVPLQGHTRGHVAVAVRDANGWLLHCGDAYFFHGEVMEPPHCTPGFAIFQRLMAFDDGLRVKNQARLRALHASATDVHLFSAHDPVELARLQGASAASSIAAQ
jgi:glyoxylase-like metal-dependent hydrolase (beta-lactamase superfamily II)